MNRVHVIIIYFFDMTEGSRSRTGKAMVPKSGLLSIVVNAVLEGLYLSLYVYIFEIIKSVYLK